MFLILLLISRLINRTGLRISQSKVFSSDKAFKGNVVNRTMPYLHVGSLDMTLTVSNVRFLNPSTGGRLVIYSKTTVPNE